MYESQKSPREKALNFMTKGNVPPSIKEIGELYRKLTEDPYLPEDVKTEIYRQLEAIDGVRSKNNPTQTIKEIKEQFEDLAYIIPKKYKPKYEKLAQQINLLSSLPRREPTLEEKELYDLSQIQRIYSQIVQGDYPIGDYNLFKEIIMGKIKNPDDLEKMNETGKYLKGIYQCPLIQLYEKEFRNSDNTEEKLKKAYSAIIGYLKIPKEEWEEVIDVLLNEGYTQEEIKQLKPSTVWQYGKQWIKNRKN
ncbi:MAG: hypothetical protein GXN99_01605 [Candidatus Nanohaloarchaeota archaeon]|nr:hypothetical protein [Candidatus Nanohaloarchaeota archaeon]